MKALILGDCHHGKGDDYFLKKQIQFLDEMISLCDEYSIRNIFFLGDLYDRRRIGDFRTLSIFREKYYELCKGKECVAIRGNHDSYFSNTGEISSLKFLLPETVEFVENDMKVFLKNNYNLCFIPWIDSSNKDELLQKIKDNNNENSILFGHLELSGFKISSVYISDKTQISEFNIKKYKKVISGHFHNKQEQGNVLYVGSPYELTFDEIGMHGCHILDFNTGELNFIENKNSIFKKVIIEDNLKEAEIRKKLEGIEDKIVSVFIDSDNGNYILKIETLIEQLLPYKVAVKIKESEVSLLSNSTIIAESETDIVSDFIESVEYRETSHKSIISKLFKHYLQQASL